MMLTENNIKAELSYAYLHAICSRAGCEAVVAGRHRDSGGVDAVISAKERFAADSVYTDFSIHVQLKATSAEAVPDANGCFPYSLRLDHYNKLRDADRQSALILVVLFLPADPASWLVHTTDGLVARRCAYWMGLRGAPESANQTSQTIYLPSRNVFSVDGLRTVLTRASRNDLIDYEPPLEP